MLLAMLLGGIAGLLHIEGLSIVQGVLVGIAAVGGVTVAQKAAGTR